MFMRTRETPVPVRSWPLLVLAVPAAVAVWSGWVGIGQMTGFGVVAPLPGIWDSLRINTAVTLPVGVEAYGAMALHAWLSGSQAVSARTRRFAMWSAIGSLVLGVSGQVTYHRLAEVHVTRAPWGVTTLVASLPVVVLGLGTALAHMLRADAFAAARGPLQTAAGPGGGPAGPVQEDSHSPDGQPDGDQLEHEQDQDQAAAGHPDERSSLVSGARERLLTDGRRISRRSLRAAGVRGSNAELSELAHRLRTEEISRADDAA